MAKSYLFLDWQWLAQRLVQKLVSISTVLTFIVNSAQISLHLIANEKYISQIGTLITDLGEQERWISTLKLLDVRAWEPIKPQSHRNLDRVLRFPSLLCKLTTATAQKCIGQTNVVVKLSCPKGYKLSSCTN